MIKSFLVVTFTFLLGFCSSAEAQTQITSAGAKTGWTYFGTLKSAISDSGPQWTDLHFSWTVTTVNTSKMLTKNLLLTCKDVRTLRSGPVSVAANGTLEWPPIIGVLAPNTNVRIIDVSQHTTSEGIAFWVNVSSAE